MTFAGKRSVSQTYGLSSLLRNKDFAKRINIVSLLLTGVTLEGGLC